MSGGAGRDRRSPPDRCRGESLTQVDDVSLPLEGTSWHPVGTVARLTEAEAKLDEAFAPAARKLAEARPLAQFYPEASVSNAEPARALADQAAQLAEEDVTDYQRAMHGGGSGRRRGGSGRF